jgi:hypothetical protein
MYESPGNNTSSPKGRKTREEEPEKENEKCNKYSRIQWFPIH